MEWKFFRRDCVKTKEKEMRGRRSRGRMSQEREIHVTRMTKKVIPPDGGPVAGENGDATESH